MCLAVPGRVVRWIDRDPLFASADVEFDGVRRVCHMACVPEAEVGDYVIVHAGVAIGRIDEAAALRTLRELAASGELPESDDAAGARDAAASVDRAVPDGPGVPP